ncbi:MAG: hypothetical protein GXO65_02515 [Euryarchaeota archaeon]|nr:hypothetical protein [Euryarchaeota archaeon]
MSLRLAVRLWTLSLALGALVATALDEAAPASSGAVAAGISSLPELASPLAFGNPFLLIFIKNSLASLTIIFLGPLLCVLEMWIFTSVPEETYGFLESLTAPFYRVAGTLHPPFKDLAPFFRSCYFYLYFVPLLALAANGAVLGFLLVLYTPGHVIGYLLPHGILEFPAFFASVILALGFARDLEGPISRAELDGLKAGLGGLSNRRTLLRAAAIQLLLLLAAYLEVVSAP